MLVATDWVIFTKDHQSFIDLQRNECMFQQGPCEAIKVPVEKGST